MTPAEILSEILDLIDGLSKLAAVLLSGDREPTGWRILALSLRLFCSGYRICRGLNGRNDPSPPAPPGPDQLCRILALVCKLFRFTWVVAEGRGDVSPPPLLRCPQLHLALLLVWIGLRMARVAMARTAAAPSAGPAPGGPLAFSVIFFAELCQRALEITGATGGSFAWVQPVLQTLLDVAFLPAVGYRNASAQPSGPFNV